MRLLVIVAGRVTALALFAGAVSLVYFGLVRPYAGRLAELEHDRRVAAASIERITARVQNRDGIADRMAELEQQLSRSEAHIRAGTTALGTAELQRLLIVAASRHDVQVQSTQALPSAEEMGLQRITLRADLVGLFPGLIELLHDLESGRPYIFVDAVDIKADGITAAESQHPALSVRLDLVAYMIGSQT